MFARLLFLCVSSALFFHSSFANQGLGLRVFVPLVEPLLVVAPSPEVVLRGRLRVFFNEYHLDEAMGSTIEDRIVAQLLSQYGGGVSLINEQDFLPFLLDYLNVPTGEHAQIMERVRASVGLDFCSVLIRAVYEARGVSASIVASHVESIARLLDAGTGLLEAYWTDYFCTHGLNAAQAQKAAASMCDFIKAGTSVKHAYWHSVFLQFGFHESEVHALVGHAVELEGQELSYSEILTAVLFSTQEGVDEEGGNAFRLRIAEGALWVEAFFYAHYAHYSRVMGVPLLGLRAAQAYVAELDRFGFQFGRFERIIYEQYGFPQTVARAAVDCLNRMREECPGEDAAKLFWWAAFRVLGVGEDSLAYAYAWMLEAEVDNFVLQRAFELAYVEVIGSSEIELGEFFKELDRELSLWGDEETRVETLLDVLWGRVFPNVSCETRAGALRGFRQSPSALSEILAMLGRSNQANA